MELSVGRWTISDDKTRLDIETVCGFLSRSYWANQSTESQTRKAIDNSICFGVYEGTRQIGFARVVTDGATVFYLCDVFVDEEYRGQGIGKALVEAILQTEPMNGLNGILGTKDAHSLYERYGFVRDPERFMRRRVAVPAEGSEQPSEPQS